jgi:O-antigen/teichoic acid export membrane protein
MIGLRMADRFVGVISLTILARVLLPGDFGLVSLAVVTLAFFEMFGQTQVDLALIRDRNAGRSHYDSAWTLDIARGVILALIVAAVAHPAAAFYAEPRLAFVMYAVAAIHVVAAFENVGVVDFRKELRFGQEFRYRFLSRIVGTTVTIAVAFVLRDYWALVAGSALHTVFRVALSYSMSRYRPRLDVSRIGEIFHFSKWVVAQNLFFGLRDQAPVFFIGKMLNVEMLGLFNLAKEVSGFVTTELRAPIRRALYPGFARMAVETGELREGYLASFAVLVLLSLPLAVGLYVLAAPVVEVVLGPRWAPAVPLLQILAINGIVQSFSASGSLVYNRLNRPRLTAIMNGAYLLVFLPAMAWGTARIGVAGAAWAIVATGAVLLIVDIAVVCRILVIDVRGLLREVWRPVFAAACLGAVVAVLAARLRIPAETVPALAMLAMLTVAGAVVYAAALLLAWRASGGAQGAERTILGALEGIFLARRQLGSAP